MERIEKRVQDSRTTMTEMIMPNDTNPIHNLMGGNLLRWMDIAAGVCAGKHCESYVVTVSVDSVSFEKPIPLGDVITIECSVTRAFNTSVEVFVEVFSSDIKGKNTRKCNDAYFTFVGVDDNKRPIKIPAVLPLTQEEENRYESAQKRRELRLIMSGRIEPNEAHNLKKLFAK
ncbi:MAG: acyl-CoA thioesterase [Saprospiraceae bacterium]|nr:acyl-CoA thioesterase [Saprospiraceae bacterium]